MKIAFWIARILLGLIFTVFGLNGFLHFLPMGPLPQGPAMQFITAVSQTHFMAAIFVLQLICGILLLANQFVPLAITLSGGIVFNIVLFHVTMAPAGLPLALFTLLLWIIVFAGVRRHFAGIFAQKAGLVLGPAEPGTPDGVDHRVGQR